MSVSSLNFRPALSQYAGQLANERTDYVADRVMPMVSADANTAHYWKADQVYQVPAGIQVGPRGAVPIVGAGSSLIPYTHLDYGVDGEALGYDVSNNSEVAMLAAVRTAVNALLLAREIRVINAVNSAANYAAGQTIALAGGQQWNTTTGDPIGVLTRGADLMAKRPNKLVLTQAVLTELKNNVKIQTAIRGNAGGQALTNADIALLFDVQQVIVFSARQELQAPGVSPPVVGFAGGNQKFAALLHVPDVIPTVQEVGASWGFTSKWVGPIRQPDGTLFTPPDDVGIPIFEHFNPLIGARGTHYARALQSVRELITENRLGYLVQTAVA
jgi:hypothetical protein